MAQQDTQPEKETPMNPWKIATLAIVGASAAAIADGGNGAGKGAGIGALLGATAGTFYGFDQEQRKTEQAQAAYEACLRRRS